MAIGVSLWFDDVLEARVRAMWAEFARLGISRALHDGPYRPHVTLGVWEQLDLGRFVPALRAMLEARSAPRIAFESIGAFPGDEGVAFLAPRVTLELIEMHRDAHALAGTFGSGPFAWCVPDAWVPHCTMAWRAPATEIVRAVAVLLDSGLPWSGTARSAGIIDTPAEVELFRIAIGT